MVGSDLFIPAGSIEPAWRNGKAGRETVNGNNTVKRSGYDSEFLII
jgi:hypothetical protein